MRMLPICCLLTLVAFAAAGEVVMDQITLKDKGPANRWIVAETVEEVRSRLSPDPGQEYKTPRREIKSVLYAFQRQSGAYSQGLEARERGKFAESAELFGQLAAGEREAEQVVGAFEAGASWELDGKHALAATEFAKVVDKFPAHPRTLDARYRLGMSLAMAKDAKSEEVAKKLEEDAKGNKLGQQANIRAAAIRAALALNKGDAAELKRMVSKASFSAENERDAWLHFNLFIADAQQAAGQGKEASAIYERMLPALGGDPAAAARVRLGIGLGKVDTDRQGAIVALLALDALPNGSPEQKCEARYHAGRLMWAEVQAMPKAAADDERKRAYAAESLATARLLLQAAAESTSAHPAKALAAEVLKTLPLDPAEQAKLDAENNAKAEAEAAAKAKADAEAKKKGEKPKDGAAPAPKEAPKAPKAP